MTLIEQLSKVERRWKWVHFVQAGGKAVLLLIAVLVLASVVDYIAPLTFLQRTLLTGLCYGTVLSFCWLGWIRPFRKLVDAEEVAWLIENAVPELNEEIISAVELSKQHDEHLSIDLIESILRDAQVDMAKIVPRRVFPVKRKHFIIPAILAGLFLTLLSVPSLKMGRLVKRVVFPSRNDATVGRYDLLVDGPGSARIAEGESVTFVVRCTDATVKHIELCLEDHRVRKHLMKYDEESSTFRYTIENAKKTVKYWAQAGNIASRAYDLTVLKLPRIDKFTITYNFPGYMGLPSAKSDSTSGNIKAYHGATVDIKIKASKSLSAMSIKWLDAKSEKLSLSSDGKTARASFVLEKSGDYSLSLKDLDGLTNKGENKYLVTVLADNPPVVVLEKPKTDMHLGPRDIVQFKWLASDDFGVEKQKLLFSINGKAPKSSDLKKDIAGHKMAISDLKLNTGDEVEFWIQVFDASGQNSESQHRVVYVSRSGELLGVANFTTAAKSLNRRLVALDGRLNVSKDLHDKIRLASKYSTGANAENLPYNKLMLKRQQDKMEEELTLGEADSREMKKSGFFPKSQVCSDLTGKYINQEKVFSLPAIDETDGEAVEELSDMTELGRAMTEALLEKADEHVMWVNASTVIRSAEALKGLSKKAALALRKQISARIKSASDAGKLNIPIADNSKQGQKTSGLKGSYFKGRTSYVLENDPLMSKPDLVRYDPVINFPNAGSFKFERQNIAVLWTGYIKTDIKGAHTFFVSSDDGSRLYINGKQAINNDGPHGILEKSAKIHLEKGQHRIIVAYQQGGGDGAVFLHWQQPGKNRQLIPAGALSATHADAFGMMLSQFESATRSRAADFRKLNDLANRIRRKLRSTSERLKEVARDIDLYERAEDWNKVSELAKELKKEETEDLTKVAEVLEKAVKDKDTDQLVEVAEVLPEIEKYQELLELKEDIDALEKEAEKALSEAEKDLAQKKKDDAIDELSKLESEVEHIEESSIAGEELKKEHLTKPVHKELAEAHQHLEEAQNAIEEDQKDTAKKEIETARKDIKEAGEAMDRVLANLEEERNAAVAVLGDYDDDKSDKLKKAEALLAQLPAMISAVDPTSPESAEEAKETADEVAEDVNEIVDRLKSAAEEEIKAKEGNVDEARDKLAIADVLDEISEEKLKPAQEALLKASEPVEEKQPDSFWDKLTSGADERKREKNLEKAKDSLEEALVELKDVKELLEKSDAIDEKELSKEEEKLARADLEKFAEETLSEELLDTLSSLEKLRAGQDDAEQLVEEVNKLKARPKKNAAEDLSEDAQELKDDLDDVFKKTAGHDLEEEKPDVSPDELLRMAEKLAELKKDITQAAAVEEASSEIKDNLLESERSALALFDKIPMEELYDKKSIARLEKDKEKIELTKTNRSQKRQGLTDMANVINKEYPEIAKAAKELAAEMQKEDWDARLVSELDAMEKRESKEAQRRAKELESLLASEEDPLSEHALSAVKELKDNLEAGKLDDAKKNADAIAKDLEEIEKLSSEEPEKSRDELVADGIKDLEKALSAVPQEDKKKLSDAIEAAKKGDIDKAKQLAEELKKPREEEAKITDDLYKAEDFKNNAAKMLGQAEQKAAQQKYDEAATAAELANMDKPLVEALKKAAEKTREAAEKAFEDISNADENKMWKLKEAAEHALNNNIDHAINLAKQAGEDGKEAVKALEKAKAAGDKAKKMLSDAKKNVDKDNKAAAEAKADLKDKIADLKKKPQDPAAKEELPKLQRADQHAQKDEYRLAADNTKSAAKGAYEVKKAAEKLAQALEMDKEPEKEKAERSANVPRKAKGKVAEAQKNLEETQKDLEQGKAERKTAVAAERTEDAIAEAADIMAEEALAIAEKDEEPEDEAADSDGDKPGEKGGREGLDDPEIDEDEAGLDKSWEGVDTSLGSKDKKRGKQKYDDYYRNANMRYLEKINKEK